MKLRLSVVVLIAANCVPLAGVFLWGWSVFEIVLLYWAENVAIGVINVLKMIVASPNVPEMEGKLTGFARKIAAQGKSQEDRAAGEAMEFYAGKLEDHAGAAGMVHHGLKFFMVPFFCVHYGMFCFVHGIFVVALLGGDRGVSAEFGLGALKEVFKGSLLVSALVLGASHLFSFFVNFLGKGECRRTSVPQLMRQPYGRIVVLHLAIIFGAFATMALGSPVFLLMILIAGKTVLDVKLHLRERRKSREGLKYPNTQIPKPV